VRARVKATSGITLNWEIIRLGLPTPGHPIGEGLAILNSPADQAQT
jgi:UDP-N-acetylmuramate dehydrogenase